MVVLFGFEVGAGFEAFVYDNTLITLLHAVAVLAVVPAGTGDEAAYEVLTAGAK